MKILTRKELGNLGENIAEKFLLDKGFLILEKNFTIWGGEIDICAFKDNILHIVEVKTSTSYILPQDHINYKKLKTLIKTAEYFLKFKLKSILKDKVLFSHETILNKELSFCIDIILVNLDKKFQVKQIEFLEKIEI